MAPFYRSRPAGRTRYHAHQRIDPGMTMNADTTPTHAQLQQQLDGLRLGVGPSEVHGSLSGYLCAGGKVESDNWLERLQLHGDDPSAALDVQGSLARLAQATAEAIKPDNGDLELLLPPDDAGLEARALGLVDWCRGFLGGFGLAGVDAAGLDPGMAAILRDFADIAATVPAPDNDADDRAALGELVDHARFGALLLHTALTVPQGATRQ